MTDTVPDVSADPATVPAPPKKESKGSAVWREIKGLLWVLLAVILFQVPIKGSVLTLFVGGVLYVLASTGFGLLLSRIVTAGAAAPRKPTWRR